MSSRDNLTCLQIGHRSDVLVQGHQRVGVVDRHLQQHVRILAHRASQSNRVAVEGEGDGGDWGWRVDSLRLFGMLAASTACILFRSALSLLRWDSGWSRLGLCHSECELGVADRTRATINTRGQRVLGLQPKRSRHDETRDQVETHLLPHEGQAMLSMREKQDYFALMKLISTKSYQRLNGELARCHLTATLDCRHGCWCT